MQILLLVSFQSKCLLELQVEFTMMAFELLNSHAQPCKLFIDITLIEKKLFVFAKPT